MKEKSPTFSRRDFAKAAALTTAGVLVPIDLRAQQQKPAPEAAKESTPPAQKLSSKSQAEADLAYETLMKKYGSRFTDEQKRDIKRLVNQQQSGLDKLRAFAVSNSDEPSTVFLPLIPEERR
jgi:hypothetical protein